MFCFCFAFSGEEDSVVLLRGQKNVEQKTFTVSPPQNSRPVRGGFHVRASDFYYCVRGYKEISDPVNKDNENSELLRDEALTFESFHGPKGVTNNHQFPVLTSHLSELADKSVSPT